MRFSPFSFVLRATLVINNNACQNQMIYAALMAFFIFIICCQLERINIWLCLIKNCPFTPPRHSPFCVGVPANKKGEMEIICKNFYALKIKLVEVCVCLEV